MDLTDTRLDKCTPLDMTKLVARYIVTPKLSEVKFTLTILRYTESGACVESIFFSTLYLEAI